MSEQGTEILVWATAMASMLVGGGLVLLGFYLGRIR